MQGGVCERILIYQGGHYFSEGSQYRLMPPHVTCGWSMHTVSSKGNPACNSGNIKTSCLCGLSLLTLDLSMVQRRQMKALSKGISMILLWMCGLCGIAPSLKVMVSPDYSSKYCFIIVYIIIFPGRECLNGSVNAAHFWCTQVVNARVNAKCVYPLTSLHVMRSPRPFLAILEYCKQWKSEAGEGLGTILFAVYTSNCNPTCYQDPVFQFLDGLVPRLCHLPLPQTPTVIPIPGNLLLLLEYLDTISPVTAKQITTWTDKDTVLAQVQRFVLHGWLLKSQREECSAARIGGELDFGVIPTYGVLPYAMIEPLLWWLLGMFIILWTIVYTKSGIMKFCYQNVANKLCATCMIDQLFIVSRPEPDFPCESLAPRD